MVCGFEQNYISAYNALLASVPELREKIMSGNIIHKDILKIARSVIFTEKYDGSFHISKNRASNERNFKVETGQIELIKKICAQYNNIPHRKGVAKQKLKATRSSSSVKNEQEDKVEIVRKKVKKSSGIDSLTPAKKTSPSLNNQMELRDFFKKDFRIPDSILGLITEYVEDFPKAVIDFAKEKRLPGYLKDITNLDLSQELIDFKTFCKILLEFKSLKSLKLPVNVNAFWIAEVLREFPGLKSLDITGNKEITDTVLNHIAENLNSLEKLVLKSCEHVTNKGVDFVIQKLQNLKELHVLHCDKITDSAFENIEKRSETLRSLHLSHKITDKFLINISTCLKNLQTLSLEFCSDITDNGIDHLIQNLNQLQHIHLEYCEISDHGLRNISNLSDTLETLKIIDCSNINCSFLVNINKNFEVMKELVLVRCERFEGRNLSNCTGRFPALESLDLSDNEGLGSEDVIGIVQKATNLKHINLDGNESINDEALKCIADNCSNLRRLSISKCNITNSGVDSIAKSCRDLLEIDMSMCGEVDDDGLKSLANNCHKLYILSLNYCSKITDVGLNDISVGFPDLTCIELKKCFEITDLGILSLSQKIKELQVLILSECTKISSRILSYISKWNNSMFAIDLENCQIADEDFVNLAVVFPDLIYLNLSDSHIGDFGISKFSKLFPSLIYLEIDHCKNITDVGVDHMTKNSNISSVSLIGSTGITKDSINKLRDKKIAVSINDLSTCVIS